MSEQTILERLGYSKCSCKPDYRPALAVVNSFCLEHDGSFLTLDGKLVEELLKAQRNQQVDTK